jgi:hypothetical protein
MLDRLIRISALSGGLVIKYALQRL